MHACRRRELVGTVSGLGEKCKHNVDGEAATKKHQERPDEYRTSLQKKQITNKSTKELPKAWLRSVPRAKWYQ